MFVSESAVIHSLNLKPISPAYAAVSCSFSRSLSREPLIMRTNFMNLSTKMTEGGALRLCCSDFNHSAPLLSTTGTSTGAAPRVIKKRKRYRKEYPGESKGITEELRFVAMRLRNVEGKKLSDDAAESPSEDETEEKSYKDLVSSSDDTEDSGDGLDSWQPSLEGFVKYFVDSKLVFSTVEQIVDESCDVAYSHFRKTGLERSDSLAKDLEWFSEQGVVIPEPSNQGILYAQYLEQLAESSAPLFLCHYYNIYFSHLAGGQVIARQVSERLLEGRELEFYTWEGDAQELLKCVREKLNMLGEHWSRDEKNKCLREATKSFRYLGQIVRLIIL